MISSKAREQELTKAHDKGIRTLRSAQSSEINKSFTAIRKTRSEALQKHRERFGTNREALKEKQSGERSELRQAWQERKTERERVNTIIQKRDNIREKSKDSTTSENSEENRASKKFERARRARDPNRKRKGRVRKRKVDE